MKKSIYLVLVAIFALTFASCSKDENLQTKEVSMETWLRQNAYVVNDNYTNESGVQGVLYETYESHQQIFQPNENLLKHNCQEYYHILGSGDGCITCSGDGHCCEVYGDLNNIMIDINPICKTILQKETH